VLRWKLAVQEYDAFVAHIAGELNVVADGLSRLTLDTPTTDDCWTDIDDNEDLSIIDIPDENQLIMHEANNQNTVDVENSASRVLLIKVPTPLLR
jgi:hypothetical protein